MAEEWSAATKNKLRRVLHIADEDENRNIMLKYSEMYELFDANFPTWAVRTKVDWCVACALAPNWFGDDLSTRINNTMLVSALLITVTAAFLLEPPQYAVPDYSDEADGPANGSTVFFFYMTSICNLMFIISIILGIAFVENAMSRSYTEADKMILIAKHYIVLNLTQIFSTVGSFLFIVVLLIPTFKVYDDANAAVMCVITVGLTAVCTFVYVRMNVDSGNAQHAKTEHFMQLVDAETGRLKPEFYPPNADMSPDMWREMYMDHAAGSSA